MEWLINFILTWGSGFAVGWWAASKASQAAMKNILENAGVTERQLKQAAINMGMDMEEVREHFDDEDGETVISIRVEKHGKQLLAYQMETDQFLTQATTAKRLIDQLGEMSGERSITYNIDPNDGLKYLQKELDKRAERS
jgi:uncharacterized protein YneF (UPF0154 family)